MKLMLALDNFFRKKKFNFPIPERVVHYSNEELFEIISSDDVKNFRKIQGGLEVTVTSKEGQVLSSDYYPGYGGSFL